MQIAEYFKVPLKNALAKGDKASLSDSVIPGGGDDPLKNDGEVFKKTLNKIDEKKREANLKRARNKLQSLIQTDPRLNNFTSNLRLSLTDDGLLIQITDSADRPMFKVGSPVPESYMVNILQALVPVLNELPNRIIMTGHTDALPYANGEAGYSNWELSSRLTGVSVSWCSARSAPNKSCRKMCCYVTLSLCRMRVKKRSRVQQHLQRNQQSKRPWRITKWISATFIRLFLMRLTSCWPTWKSTCLTSICCRQTEKY